MSDSQLVEFVRQAILSGLIVIAPVILMGFIIGTLMGLVQAATGIHEPMVERMVELLRTAAGGS